MKKLLKGILLGAVMLGITLGSLGINCAVAKEKYEFLFVCQWTGIDFFRPIIQGMNDAGRILGNVEARMIGPVGESLSEQVAAFNAAIDANVDGIAVALFDPEAFDELVQRAMDKGIPVVAFNTDDTTPNPRMAFIGANLYGEGEIAGKLIIKSASLRKGDKVGLFMHAPHPALRQRLDGIENTLNAHGIHYEEIVTGPEMTKAVGTVESYLLGHPDVKALYGSDGITTPAIAQTLKLHSELRGKVHGCGHDLIPITLEAIKDGYMDFTMDQQPYVQGFYPVMALWLYHEYDIRPADMDTSGGFVDRSNVEGAIELVQKGYR